MTKLQKIYRVIRETAPHMSKEDARYAAIRLYELGFFVRNNRIES